MRRCSRSFLFFVIILTGLLSPVTGLEDATLAATVWGPLATVDDPDVDPVSLTEHLTPLDTAPTLPPYSVPKAALPFLGQILPFMGRGASQCLGLSFRIPRAPPVS